LEGNILSRFGCPRRIIIDNDVAFKYKKIVKFCNDYGITLSYSTTYYPQGNGLVESSNKRLIRIIKNLLQENNKSWHKKMIFSLWEDRVSTKKSIGTSPLHLVYGADVVFPTSLGLPVMKLLQGVDVELNKIQRRICQQVHVHQMRGEVYKNAQLYQEKMKNVFDRRTKDDDF
jgi:transposase InsO family protein